MFSFKKFIYFLIGNFVYSQDCNLMVPNNALGNGLFSPWIVSTNSISDTPCTQLDKKTSVFVEATILDADTGNFFVYYPLVLDANTTAASPISSMPLPVNSIVTIHFGTNANSITLIPENGDSLANYNCVNGINNSVFGQFAYCNSVNFFSRVQELINIGVIKVPVTGCTLKGDYCPTTRHFAVIDQDQSDNVLSEYILTNDFKVAQNNVGNRNNLNVTKIITNGSDNRLLNIFILPALSCTSFTAPDLIETNVQRSSLALNEISAKQNALNGVQALIPAINPMTLVNDAENLDKVNSYRIGVNMHLLYTLNNTDNLDYCNNFYNIAPSFYKKYGPEFAVFPSPDPNVANNLLNFLVFRFINSWLILKCDVLTGKKSPLSVINDQNGVAISNNICNTTTTYNLMTKEVMMIKNLSSTLTGNNQIIIFAICFIFIFFI